MFISWSGPVLFAQSNESSSRYRFRLTTFPEVNGSNPAPVVSAPDGTTRVSGAGAGEASGNQSWTGHAAQDTAKPEAADMEAQAPVAQGIDADAAAGDVPGTLPAIAAASETADSEAVDTEVKPWKLFRSTNLDLGGWSQTGYHNRSTGMFNNRPDQLQLHQQWFYAEKKADGEHGTDFGFRMDYVYGTDGPDTQAFGNPPGSWDEGWDNGGAYGHAIPQLYGEIASGDFSVKVGHFFTPVGYEVVQAPGNFFYSHAYTMYNAEPFTHSGALATLAMGDLTTYAGWSNGWDTGFADNGGSTFLGGASLDLNEETNLTYITTIGRIGNGTDQQGYSHSIVLNRQLTDRTSWIAQSDLLDFDGTLFADRKAFGINNYLITQLNDRWSTGTRFEWWRPEVAPGDRADLYSLTFGLNWKPHCNMVFRPEVRWSRDDAGIVVPAPDNNRLGFGIDLIVTF